MRNERISCSITNHNYMPSAGLHGPLHMAMVCVLCPRSACTHTVTLPAAAWAEGWRGGGVCVLKYILIIPFE